MPRKKKAAQSPLTGDALLAKIAELGEVPKEEKAKECGYVTTTKNGQERVNMMKFYNALMEAKGIELEGNGEAPRRGGKPASYRISVQSNGNLLIGSAYTKRLDLNPGDEFEIKLGRKHIQLVKVGESEDDSN